MIIKSVLLVPVVALMLGGSVCAEASDSVEELKVQLTIALVTLIHDDMALAFRDSGLSQSDIEEAIYDLVDDTAACVFEALNQSMDRRSLSIADIPPKIEVSDIGTLFRDEAEFRELGMPCVEVAFAKAGFFDN